MLAGDGRPLDPAGSSAVNAAMDGSWPFGVTFCAAVGLPISHGLCDVVVAIFSDAVCIACYDRERNSKVDWIRMTERQTIGWNTSRWEKFGSPLQLRTKTLRRSPTTCCRQCDSVRGI